MQDEGYYGEGNVREEAESDNCEGGIGDSMIGKEGKNDKSGEEQEDGYDKKGWKQLDEAEDVEPARALVKVLSNMSTDMRWVILSNYLEVSAGPLL